MKDCSAVLMGSHLIVMKDVLAVKMVLLAIRL